MPENTPQSQYKAETVDTGDMSIYTEKRPADWNHQPLFSRRSEWQRPQTTNQSTATEQKLQAIFSEVSRNWRVRSFETWISEQHQKAVARAEPGQLAFIRRLNLDIIEHLKDIKWAIYNLNYLDNPYGYEAGYRKQDEGPGFSQNPATFQHRTQ
ncbi:hypothetical protein N7532_005871 [Penicillium argentinense]|uniref:Uncharacterized protein n=1 Tax=Penicillium argentinense TaxID=1131581 RepID=A0A9W9FEQ3_9EURO|nr:uncharacterized protein N7532_005871 [Penicillium argentinense]KAJ5098870.1 hypothetical protein N7532_005871 [Penicillium argentinense]